MLALLQVSCSGDCDGDCFGVTPLGRDDAPLGDVAHPQADEGGVVVALVNTPTPQVFLREHVVPLPKEVAEGREVFGLETLALEVRVGELTECRDGLGPAVAQVIGGWEEIHVFGVFQLLMVSMMRATMARTGEAIIPATPAHVRTSHWTMAPIMRSVKPRTIAPMDVMAVFSCRVERRSRRLLMRRISAKVGRVLCIIAWVCVC